MTTPPAFTATGLAAGILLLLAAGCTTLLPDGEPADIYDLSAPASFSADLPEASWQLVVEEPVAGPGFSTDGIAVREEPLRLSYYAQARWAAPAPQMVQSLMVTSFQNTDRIGAVSWRSVGLNPEYRLQSRLVRFEASYPDGAPAPVARIRLDATLIEELGQAVVASRSFEAEAEAQSAGAEDVVAAYDEAMDVVLRDLTEWALRAPDGQS